MKLIKFKNFIESIKTNSNNDVIFPIEKAFNVCFPMLEAEETTEKVDWNKYSDPMVQNGLKILKIINDAGYEAYAVGGIVRDILMNDKDIHDFDIATNMPIVKLQETFNKNGFKITDEQKGKTFGVLIVSYQGETYEIANFRSESGYTDKRRPDVVEFNKTFKEDTARRDLTMNAMGIDVNGNIVDYWGGKESIKNKQIETVGKAEERFNEDPLRIIRTIRFASRFSYAIKEDTLEAIKKYKNLIVDPENPIPPERIRDEFVKTMSYGGDKFAYFIKLLSDTGIFELICPEIELTTDKIEAIKRANSKDPHINFSLLLNGKNKNDITKFAERFKLENDERDSVVFVSSYLELYPHLVEMDKEKALLLVSHKYFPVLRAAYIAINGNDIEGADKLIEEITSYNEVKSRVQEINKIIQDKGIPQSKRFGDISKAATSWLFKEFSEGRKASQEELSRKIDELIK
jgi:tRNA nucleotidyltransferase/poly(A) polymerase